MGVVATELELFQRDHRAWLDRLYPDQLPVFPAAGLVEESGELMRALLKCQQANGGKHPERRYVDADFNAMLVDAVGDCAIFVCSLCSANNLAFAKVVADASLVLPKPKEAFLMAAKLCGQAAYVCEDPRERGAIVYYVAHLLRLCETWNIDFRQAIATTWEEVRCRE